MEANNDVQKFLEVHPKYKAEPASDELIERYINIFPEMLLRFWKEHGLGTYGKGFIQFINPDEYRETVNMWLMREDDGTRIPFAISAFGDVFYWRHLYNPNPTEDFPEWVFDVSYFNPHDSRTGLCAYTMDEFFGEYIVNSEIINAFKWQYHSGYSTGLMEDALAGHQNPDNTLFEKAVQKLGVLEKDEMYFFVPALRLGGIDDIEYVEEGNAPVHLDILFQLTGEEPYDPKNDYYDFYGETDKLGGEPVNFDRRIEELKSEMDGTDDAYKHYMIAKLFDEYPYWHESIQNPEAVEQRLKENARFHHNKAKELDPENAKYFYASYDSLLNDYKNPNWSMAEQDLEKFYALSGNEEQYYRGKLKIASNRNEDEGVMHYAEKLYEFNNLPSELHAAAVYFQLNGKPDKALEIYRRTYDDSPEYHDAAAAACGIANALKEKREKSDALKIFDDLHYKFPEQEAEILNYTGLFLKSDYNSKNRLEEALPYFKKAVEKGEQHAMESYELAAIYHNLYNTYIEMDEFENAKTAIEKAIELTDDHYYHEEKSRLLFKMGDDDETKEITSKVVFPNWQETLWALDSSPEAFNRKIEKTEAQLQQDPTDTDKQFLLGKLYEKYPVYMMPLEEQDNQYKLIANAGYVALCEATELEPKNPLYQLHLAEFLYNNHFYMEIDDETRKEIMTDAYQFYIDHAENPYEGYEGLKKMAMFEDDWETIIKYARLAYETNPEMTHELLDLGNAYNESGRYNEAAQAYQEYLQAEPDFHNQLNGKQGLAETYIKSGDSVRAEKMLEEVAQNTESNNDKYEVYQKASDAFRFNEDWENALKFQEKAVYFAGLTGDNEFTYPTAILELSSLYETMGNLKEAITLARKNCSIRGDDYDYSRLGYLIKENNQPDEARTALKKALELNPDDQYSKDLLEELGGKKGGGFFGKWF